MAHGKWIFNYPIETLDAKRFWSSDHKCNVAKAYAAFSKDADDYNELMKRAGYKYQWRKRALANFEPYIGSPDMLGIPFSQLENRWWNCMCPDGSVDLQWIITEITEETITTENCRPVLTEDSEYLGSCGPEQPLPVQAWLITEITELEILTEDGLLLISENYTTSVNVPCVPLTSIPPPIGDGNSFSNGFNIGFQ